MKLRNKRILSLFLSLALVIGVMFGAAPKVFAEDVKSLTILHVNDVHGRIEYGGNDKSIGFSKLKTGIDELKKVNPNVLLLNAGDTFHGTVDINLTEGETIVKLMNLVGFDAMVPGNHDFNYGYERLMELKEMAEFPLLGANIVKEEDGTSDFEPYVVKEFEGFKVGIFGLGTEETKFKSDAKNTIGIEFADPVETAEKMVKKLQELEVDVIIALVHLGIEGTTLTTSKDIAEKVKGIDVIIDGHSHEKLNELIGDTLLVQAGSYMNNVGAVEIEIVEGKVSSKNASLITYEDAENVTPDPTIDEEIVAIGVINAPIKEVIVGKANVDLDGERANVRTGETNLGNLIADVMLKSVDADVAIANGGGIRASIPAGEVNVGHILASFPFSNTIAVIEVTGAELIEALEHGVDLYPNQAGHFAHVSGMTYKFDEGKPVGERVVEVIIDGEPIDIEKIYKLATNNFMAEGNDGYIMFKGKKFIAEAGLLSDVLIEYIKEVGEVAPEVEGRITVIPAPEVVEEPVVVPAPEPTLEPVLEPVAAVSYVVKAGDVLWKIAKQFNTTWEKLAEHNNLKNPHLIFPNQVILIP